MSDNQDVPRNDLALRIATDVLGDPSRADGLAEYFAKENSDVHHALERFAESRCATLRADLARVTKERDTATAALATERERYETALNEAIADERHTKGERSGLRMAAALYRAQSIPTTPTLTGKGE